MKKIKSCPYFHNKNIKSKPKLISSSKLFQVACECGARGPAKKNEKKAIKCWNNLSPTRGNKSK